MNILSALPQRRYSPRNITGGLRVLKYHALGNSYLIVDPADLPPDSPPDVVGEGRSGDEEGAVLSPWFVEALGEKTWGIGSNGVLFGPFTGSDGGVEFQIYNTDGTRAELSGNGLRIFCRFLFDAGYLSYDHDFQFPLSVVTPADRGLNRERIVVDVIDPRVPVFAVDIGTPKFGPNEVHALSYRPGADTGSAHRVTVDGIAEAGRRCGMGWLDSVFVSVGNPHCVTFVEGAAHLPNIDQLRELSKPLTAMAFRPSIGDGKIFAEGCNLQWAYVRDRAIIDLRIFERGEGPTEASGSSASAATSAAFHRGLIDRLVTVQMPGGDLEVELRGSGARIESVIIRGSATRIMDAQVDLVDFGSAAKVHYLRRQRVIPSRGRSAQD